MKAIITRRQLPDASPLEGVFRLQKIRFHLHGALKIKTADVQQFGNGRIGHGGRIKTGHLVNFLQASLQARQRFFGNQIDFVKYDAIRESDLRQDLVGTVVEVIGNMLSVDERDDAIQFVLFTHILIYKKRLRHGARVRHAGRFQDHPVKFIFALDQFIQNTN